MVEANASDPAQMRIKPLGRLAGLPGEGIVILAARWLLVEKHGSYRANFDLKAVDQAVVRSMTGGEPVELRCGKDGWARVKDGRTIQEPPCDELLAFLHLRQLVTATPVQPKVDPHAFIREVTQEERDICKRLGAPPNLRGLAQLKAVRPLLRLIGQGEAK
ncbi:MAG: hypothetical protein ACYC2H_01965 [Thermoplasmatota archaeon]